MDIPSWLVVFGWIIGMEQKFRCLREDIIASSFGALFLVRIGLVETSEFCLVLG
jgi:hypothetical protein